MTSESVSLLLLSCNDIPHLAATFRATSIRLRDNYSLSEYYRFLWHLQMIFGNYVITLIIIQKPTTKLFSRALSNGQPAISDLSFAMTRTIGFSVNKRRGAYGI